MTKFRIEYKEVSVGFIDVYADSLEEAMEKAEVGDGDAFINDSEIEVGSLIEEIDDDE